METFDSLAYEKGVGEGNEGDEKDKGEWDKVCYEVMLQEQDMNFCARSLRERASALHIFLYALLTWMKSCLHHALEFRLSFFT
jgi:hypothetical protein